MAQIWSLDGNSPQIHWKNHLKERPPSIIEDMSVFGGFMFFAGNTYLEIKSPTRVAYGNFDFSVGRAESFFLKLSVKEG